MAATTVVWATAAALFFLFVWWYGGRGKPMAAAEREALLQQLSALAHGPQDAELLDAVRQLVGQDDGREFVMQNLVRYRPKALYPPGYDFGDDARAADRRYGKAIVPHLLKYGNVPVFIAKRSGSFIEPDGADVWHYVAMVRYRSKRDFLRFAIAIEQKDIAVHKWAALEKTHVFPVQALVSLVMVRGTVAVLLALAANALNWALR